MAEHFVDPETDDHKLVDIHWHQSGPAIWIDWISVPAELHGQGLGRRAYEAWEAELPADIERVHIFAADSDGSGNSDGFWLALGFKYRYEPSEGELSYEATHTLVLGIRDHPTPAPILL